ncbi:MAG: type 2 lanthipeptide synthetase LanM family protein [Corynebacterium sp.]|nr:type 2 lanthipeptide synthetase LanM family protein [Corynebacterium sp.]
MINVYQDSTTVIPFANVLDQLLTPLNAASRDLVPEAIVMSKALDIISSPMVYLLNEGRIEGYLRGDTPVDRFNYFNHSSTEIANSINMLKSRFPFSVARLEKYLAGLNQMVADITSHLESDRRELIQAGLLDAQDALVSIRPTGDLHNRRTSSQLEFTSGRLLHIKWRSAATDSLLETFFQAATCGSGTTLPSITPRVLDKKTYSWVEHVTRQPLSHNLSANEAYHNIGTLLAIAYVLGLSDAHHENIMPTAYGLKVIDTETLLGIHPHFMTGVPQATILVNDIIQHSVLSTALLPVNVGSDIYGGDISGLGRGFYVSEHRVPVNIGYDTMHYARQIVERTDTAHLLFQVNEEGEEEVFHAENYISEIQQGFIDTYDTAHKLVGDFLEALPSDLRLRTLYRKTADYAAIRDYASSIRFSSNYKEVIAQLLEESSDSPPRVMKAELEALLEGEIPLFEVEYHTGRVFDTAGNLVDTLNQSPQQYYQQRITQFGEDDCDRQCALIRFAFESDGTSLQSEQTHRTVTVKEIIASLDEKQYFVPSDNSVNWLSLMVNDRDQLQLSPLDESLYGGLAGMGLALIDCQEYAGVEALLSRLFSSGLQYYDKYQLREETEFSYYSGALGLLSFLKSAGLVLEKEKLIAPRIENFFDALAKQSASFRGLDVMAGAAGVLLALGDPRNQVADAPIITRLGDSILAAHMEKWRAKKVMAGDNASFAHGPSGHASALLNAYVITREPRFFEGWLAAWNFEKLFINNGLWVDTRTEALSPSAHWCHGLTGIMLARAHWVELDERYGLFDAHTAGEIIRERDIAANGIIEIGRIPTSDSLCHGSMGNLLALKQVYPARSFRNFEKEVFKHAQAQGWNCGLGTGIPSLSPMAGLSGILHAAVLLEASPPVRSPFLWPRW